MMLTLSVLFAMSVTLNVMQANEINKLKNKL
jgi:hypothetical protein